MNPDVVYPPEFRTHRALPLYRAPSTRQRPSPAPQCSAPGQGERSGSFRFQRGDADEPYRACSPGIFSDEPWTRDQQGFPRKVSLGLVSVSVTYPPVAPEGPRRIVLKTRAPPPEDLTTGRLVQLSSPRLSGEFVVDDVEGVYIYLVDPASDRDAEPVRSAFDRRWSDPALNEKWQTWGSSRAFYGPGQGGVDNMLRWQHNNPDTGTIGKLTYLSLDA